MELRGGGEAGRKDAERTEGPSLDESLTGWEPQTVIEAKTPELGRCVEPQREELERQDETSIASTKERAGEIGVEQFEDVGAELAEVVTPAGWEEAMPSQRRDLASKMHVCIQQEFGLPAGKLEFDEDLRGTPARGYYDVTSRTVSINPDLINSTRPDDVIRTLTHENRHAVQDGRVAGSLSAPKVPYFDASGNVRDAGQDEVDLWRRNFADYQQGPADYVQYRYQPIETDARAAASMILGGYYRTLYEKINDDL